MKKELNNKQLFQIFLIGIVLFSLGASVGHTITMQEHNCEGIGGFVQKEIEWQEQTINVMKKNCRNGLWINDWEVPGKQFLYCYGEECKGEYCKDITWKSPILTDSK